MVDNPIAVFDSGLGSLSVIKQLRRHLPSENLLYLADEQNFPYGNKTRQELLTIILDILHYLERYKPKLVVIASITPSVQILDEVKRSSRMDVLGITPPLKTACKLTKKKHIGILATAGTIKSRELGGLIRSHVPQNILVTRFDASEIVSLVENGEYLTNERKTFDAISKAIEYREDLGSYIDVMVLASTHLPFVSNYLGSLLPTVRLVDPVKLLVNDVKKYLFLKHMARKTGVGRTEILITSNKSRFETIIRKLGIREPAKEIFLVHQKY
ncbi:MAG TPA: glutamate racemase [Nitrososphaeraceae archaeon]|nr:glutamate racemase [Nitrososphaeraceae archaeon]